VYERGAFNGASTELTAGAFFYYAAGLTFIAVNALLVKVYYSMEDMRTPVICGIFGAAVNISLNLLLVGPMAHRGLALATSIAAVINALLLYYLLRRKYPKTRIITDWAKVLKIAIATVLSVSFSWLVFAGLQDFSAVHSLVSLVSAVAAAGAVYLIALKLFRIKELSMLREMLRF